MEVLIRVGSVEVRKVMGRRWRGASQGVGNVLRVPRRLRGPWLVRMRRVRAVSMGERMRLAMAVAAVAIRMLRDGVAEVRIEVDGRAPMAAGVKTSESDSPEE